MLLHNVPPTATPSDIYRLLPSFSRHIASITFFRLPDVQFAGRVAVSFARTSTKTGKEGEESEEGAFGVARHLTITGRRKGHATAMVGTWPTQGGCVNIFPSTWRAMKGARWEPDWAGYGPI